MEEGGSGGGGGGEAGGGGGGQGSALRLLVHSLSSDAEEQAVRKLKEAAEGLNAAGYQGWAEGRVAEVAVGPEELGLRLADGRVCRVRLGLPAGDRSDASADSAKKSQGGVAGLASAPSGPGHPGGGGGGGAGPTSAYLSRTAKIRRVMLAARSGRGGARSVIVGRPLLPASAIPEELIAQAQVVLQGKSRDAIVRELQKTNLDVNQAVNNLLSREDEDGDEEEGAEAYLPEELISLLDGSLANQDPNNPSSVILDAEALYSDGVFAEFAQGSRRLRERLASDARKDAEQRQAKDAGPAPPHAVSSPTLGPELRFWLDDDGQPLRFTAIGALHSELLALRDGKLYSWPWHIAKPDNQPNKAPKILGLGSSEDDEKVFTFSCSQTRCSLLSSSGRVGSFVDASLGRVGAECLNFPMTSLPGGPASSVHSSNLFSVARAAQGTVFWWGVWPYASRKREWEKTRSGSTSASSSGAQTALGQLCDGARVRLKSQPLYQPGSLAWRISPTTNAVQLGELMEAAWTLSETCRFRLRPNLQAPSLDASEEGASEEAATESGAGPAEAEGGSSGRKRSAAKAGLDGERVKEEAWALKDVAFLRRAEGSQAGVVALEPQKESGTCGVVFPGPDGRLPDFADLSSFKRNVRMIKTEELVPVSETAQPPSPPMVQTEPKKLLMPHSVGVLDVAVDSGGLCLLMEQGSQIYLIRCSLTGRVEKRQKVPVAAAVLRPATGLFSPRLLSYNSATGLLLLLDGNGCPVPLVTDQAGGLADPPPLFLPPVLGHGVGTVCLATPKGPKRAALTALFLQPPSLLRQILHCDVEAVKAVLEAMGEGKNLDAVAAEVGRARADGDRNVLHVLAMLSAANKNSQQADGDVSEAGGREAREALPRDSLGAPEDRWEAFVGRARRGAEEMGLSDYMELASEARRFAQQEAAAAAAAAGRGPGDQAPPAGDSSQPSSEAAGQQAKEESGATAGGPLRDAKARQKAAMEILGLVTSHSALTGDLVELLRARDAWGLTPFQLAVRGRAYSAALCLWDAAAAVAKVAGSGGSEAQTLMTMICPSQERPDDSPLFTLCYNDTCSFTWTGDEHINQDIFECRTCGLTGSFCCCTECAAVCHKGHDCHLKRTSPTAYCDCWERCACSALVQGNQAARLQLLQRLVHQTPLLHSPNSQGQHILHFLVRTEARQAHERRQYRPKPPKRQGGGQSGGPSAMPEHHLQPPAFAGLAAERLLGHWPALRSALATGLPKAQAPDAPLSESDFYLSAQSAVSHLDQFVHTLVGKCKPSLLDTLLATLIHAINGAKGSGDTGAVEMGRRFARSVVRVFVVTAVSSPVASGTAASGVSKRSSRLSSADALAKCKRVFGALAPFAMEELASAADAVLAPLRLAALKPTAAFPTSQHSDLFSTLDRLLSGDQTSSQAPGSSSRSHRHGHHSHGSAATGHAAGHSRSGEGRLPSQGVWARRHELLGAELSGEDSDFGEGGAARARRAQGPPATLAQLVSEEMERSQGMGEGREREARAEEPAEEATLAMETDGDASRDAGESELNPAGPRGDVTFDLGDQADDDPAQDSQDYFNSEDDEDNSFASDSEGEGGDGEGDGEGEGEGEGDGLGGRGEDGEEGGARESDDDDRDSDASDAPASNARAEPTDDQPAPTDASQDNVGLASAAMAARAVASAASSLRPINSAPAVVDPLDASQSASSRSQNAAAGNEVGPSERRGQGRGEAGDSRAARHAAAELSWAHRRAAHSLGLGLSASSAAAEGNPFIFLDTRAPTSAAAQGHQHTAQSSSTAQRSAQRGAAEGGAVSGRSAGAAGTRAEEAGASETASLATSASQLSRTFNLLVREMAELLPTLLNYGFLAPGLGRVLRLGSEEAAAAATRAELRLAPSFQWAASVLDRLEVQLRFGTALAARNPAASPALLLPSGQTSSRAGKSETGGGSGARRDFLLYLLSLLRAQSGEHAEDFPVLDVMSLRPMAFVADALLHLAQARTDEERKAPLHPQSAAEPSQDSSDGPGSMSRFFKRSASLSYPGMPEDLSAFQRSVAEALPLAVNPLLLRPETSKETLFGLTPTPKPQAQHLKDASARGIPHPTHLSFAAPASSGSAAGAKGEEAAPSRGSVIVPRRSPRKSRSTEGRESLGEDSGSGGEGGVAEAQALESSVERSLARWRLSLSVLAKVFSAQLASLSSGSKVEGTGPMLALAGFPIREARFRKEMERLRGLQSKDLVLEVPRERAGLIQALVKSLNSYYTRRSSSSGPPVSVHRVKVTFRDEPGEGSGVARSFYAVAAEAFLAQEPLPPLHNCQGGSGSSLPRPPSQSATHQQLLNRLRNQELRSRRDASRRRSSPLSSLHLAMGRGRVVLSPLAPPFSPSTTNPPPPADPSSPQAPVPRLWDASKQTIGDRLFPKVRTLRPAQAGKITGMLLELSTGQLMTLLSQEEMLRSTVADAVALLHAAPADAEPGPAPAQAAVPQGDPHHAVLPDATHQPTHAHHQHHLPQQEPEPAQGNASAAAAGQGPMGAPPSPPPATGSQSTEAVSARSETEAEAGLRVFASAPTTPSASKARSGTEAEVADDAPLFFQPSPGGSYAPLPGRNSAQRLNAFRNVGRLMGICLGQNELLPLPLCRHVLKFLLGREVSWWDVGFFDSRLFDSLRQVAGEPESAGELGLSFTATLSAAEGGATLALRAGGAEEAVTSENLHEYLEAYVRTRLVEGPRRALTALREGLEDALPPTALGGLSAEDLRLLLCGVSEVSISLLQSLTSFADESSAPADQLSRFKRHFWSALRKLNAEERHDLVYFWTGAAALPSSPEAFVPPPSVMIRPPDDAHLPTANTCISRLYVPLYSSKTILSAKLRQAIKAKSFGFV